MKKPIITTIQVIQLLKLKCLFKNSAWQKWKIIETIIEGDWEKWIDFKLKGILLKLKE